MAMVKSTRLRKSGMRKIFANFSNMGLLPIIMPGFTRDNQAFAKWLADYNSFAAGLLNLLLRGLGKLVSMHRDCRRELAVTEDLEQLPAALQIALGLKRLERQLLFAQRNQAIQIQHG